jgi:uroporphyrinogen-III synthase
MHRLATSKKSDHLPLEGKRIIVSRAKDQASILSDALRSLGAEVVEIPFIEIRPPQSFAALDKAMAGILNYDWLILTSVNGVKMLFARMAQLGKSEADLLHLKLAAIGPATRKAIELHGLPVDVMAEEYVAESLVSALENQVTTGERILLARAKVARDVIPASLRELGAKVDVVEAYETVLPESSRKQLEQIMSGPDKPYAITFTSSSTAKNFVDLVGEERAHSNLLDGVKLVSIGPVTSDTLRELGLRVDAEASEYTIPGLLEALVESTRS